MSRHGRRKGTNPTRAQKFLAITCTIVFFYLVLHSYIRIHNVATKSTDGGHQEKEKAISPETQQGHSSWQQPKGVFIFKAKQGHQVCRTLCTLTRFFNSGPKYPIRIFADLPSTEKQLNELQLYAGGADVQVIVDNARWRKLPPMLNDTQRATVLQHCQDFSTPTRATCTQMKVGLGYVYMAYWRYMHMAHEPALQEFDYFFSLDIDTFLTMPMPDPFKIMAYNNLTGIFNVQYIQFDPISRGIQVAAETVTSLQERTNRFLDSPRYQFFDKNGVWGSGKSTVPSIYGCAYGGRLDFFKTQKFQQYADIMAYYTYRYRTDEQAVTATAWALFADNDKVWYLPKRGIQMGLYHQGWVDNRLPVRTSPNNPNQSFYFVELNVWPNFFKALREHRNDLMGGWEYIETMGYPPGDDWEQCIHASGK